MLLATAGWAAVRTVGLRDDLQAVAGLTRRLQQQAVSGDREGAGATLAAVQRRTGAAAAAANDPTVRLAGLLPGKGQNVRAARVLATAAVRDEVPGVTLVTLQDSVCPAGTCHLIVDGILLRVDDLHLSPDGARWFVDRMTPYPLGG
ncbi:SGNH hydrolase domain-containing protein [Dactylosporangium sp. NPDC000521]|uniref:SGNH hydrolase domain-containing protein n=1 Tax=Dactylosporangium sp. NPDC000521 TaxID=3363975 RepID=UPI00368E3D29